MLIELPLSVVTLPNPLGQLLAVLPDPPRAADRVVRLRLSLVVAIELFPSLWWKLGELAPVALAMPILALVFVFNLVEPVATLVVNGDVALS